MNTQSGREDLLFALLSSPIISFKPHAKQHWALPAPEPTHGALFNHTPSANGLWVLRKDSICFARRIPLFQEELMGPVQAEMEGKEGKALEAH